MDLIFIFIIMNQNKQIDKKSVYGLFVGFQLQLIIDLELMIVYLIFLFIVNIMFKLYIMVYSLMFILCDRSSTNVDLQILLTCFYWQSVSIYDFKLMVNYLFSFVLFYVCNLECFYSKNQIVVWTLFRNYFWVCYYFIWFC